MTASGKEKPPGHGAADHFVAEELLGQGGIAEVHAAHDAHLDRTVALKTLRPELNQDTGQRERFYREARILANLAHPGAIPIYEAGTLPDGQSFYSMQKVEGRTLHELLANRSQDDISSRHKTAHFVHIFQRVCETVAFAHQHNIIHRDLKPENIMVGELGQVFVIDWGIAKELPTEETTTDSMTIVGSVVGTPGYMAPEQADGHTYESDQRTDVFSLGTILYEILTGTQPFRAKTTREALSKVRFHDPEPPTKLNKRTNRSLSAVCMKCLRKDPFQRYASAAELVQDLRRYLEHLPVTARKPRLRERLYNWVMRRPALASIVGTLAIIGFFTIFGMALHASVEIHIVSKAYDQIEAWQAERVTIGEQITRLGELPPGTRDQLSTQKELHRLRVRDQVLFDLIRGTARGITGMLVYISDEQAGLILRELFRERISGLMDQGRVVEARAYLEAVRDVSEEQTIFDYLREERKWIDDYLDRINTAQ